MKKHELFLKIARDEAQTLVDYTSMLTDIEDMDSDTKACVDEIMSDEFNHCVVALVLAREAMGLEISTDNLTPNPNTIEVTENG